MIDSQQRQAIRDRVGEEPPITASERRDPEDAVNVLWQQWTDLGAALQEFGVAPTSMCDATNEIASARAEFASEHGRTTTA